MKQSDMTSTMVGERRRPGASSV
uniref:Protein transport protein Sec61 beta subunit n=1 Tax=Arundo donax TaxID=35708 RepID=A0A0A9F1Q9_ARUDO